MTTRRAATHVVVAVLAVVLGGCGAIGAALQDGEHILSAAPVEGDPQAVLVGFSGCEDEPDVRVAETDETVTITLSGPNDGCEPLFELQVELDAPLGARSVVDGSTGDVVLDPDAD